MVYLYVGKHRMESSSGSLEVVLCCPKDMKGFCTASQNIFYLA